MKYGLTSKEVEQRKEQNLVNTDESVKTKSIKKIILDNSLNIFNIVNASFGIIIIISGIIFKIYWLDIIKSITFMFIMIINTVISICQEISSKLIVDKLSIISKSPVLSIRNGKEEYINVNDIVLDDALKFKIGNQVVVDSIVLDGVAEVNESFITGESKTVIKRKNDKILSGSFIVSGEVIVKVLTVGKDTYTSKITASTKKKNKINSCLMDSLNFIIKNISKIIVPIGIIMFIKQYSLQSNNLYNAIIRTVASMVMMIPEGLVLLTSTVLAVSVIRLSKVKVLVQELYCIETLARVDTLCLDKTGTLTEGIMEVYDCIKKDDINIEEILSSFSMNLVHNNTLEAINKKYGNKGIKANKKEEFSSSKKFSMINYNNYDYFLGAPEILFPGINVSEYSDYRVLALGSKKENEQELKLGALILLQDKIRNKAKETLEYFKSQGVDVKIISGDSTETLVKIAQRLNIKINGYVDMSKIDVIDDEIIKNTIFGRVSPFQKKELVERMKLNGHTVAMTGDGVNDVLALKEADCSIAIANGSDAAKAVSRLVLLDSNFDSIPSIVYEGRRTINNITRSATLFLSKTGYAILFTLVYLILKVSYPFEPVQISLISSLTIGIPSFVLALEDNKDRVKGDFLKNVLYKSVPVSVTSVISVLLVEILGLFLNLSQMEKSTIDVFLIEFIGFMLIFKLSIPFNKMRKILFYFCIICFIICVVFLRNFYSLALLKGELILITVILMALSIYILMFFYKIFNKLIDKWEAKK